MYKWMLGLVLGAVLMAMLACVYGDGEDTTVVIDRQSSQPPASTVIVEDETPAEESSTDVDINIDTTGDGDSEGGE